MSSNNNEAGRSRIQTLQEFSLPLIAGVIVALIWANVDHHGYHNLVHAPLLGTGHLTSLHFLVNDVFMALFFGIAAKEITEACLPGGALNPPKKAINPILGTLGGVLGPVGVYFGWMALTKDYSIANGWAIPTATDIALAWLVARMVFGPKHSAVSFLLLLAIADDGIGLAIIAVFYPDPNNPVRPEFLGLVAGAMVLAYVLRRLKVRDFWFYLLGPGVASWLGLFKAHLHPALALVPIVPFMPSSGHDEGLFAEDAGKHDDTLNRFEHVFKTPVDFGLFAFGLANAGVQMSSIGNATYAVLLSLIVGKTVGITLFSSVGRAIGFPLPEGMTGRDLVLAGMTAALGLTVALFVAGVAFTDPVMQGASKMGALGSAVAAPLVFIFGKILRPKTKPVEDEA